LDELNIVIQDVIPNPESEHTVCDIDDLRPIPFSFNESFKLKNPGLTQIVLARVKGGTRVIACQHLLFFRVEMRENVSLEEGDKHSNFLETLALVDGVFEHLKPAKQFPVLVIYDMVSRDQVVRPVSRIAVGSGINGHKEILLMEP